jgi:ABC-2 type transport system permease protein
MNDQRTPRVVRPTTAIALAYRLLLRQLVTRGRLVALLAVGGAVVAVAAAVGASDEIDDHLDAGVHVIANLGFTALVPIVALVFATAALGDAREDGTLVYLWLRPMDRWPVVLGAWLAAITVSLPLTIVPLTVAAALSGGGSSLVGATVLAAVVGVLAYAALFVLFGLLVKNSTVWGLGYVLIWEGLVAAFGSFAARLAIRGYTRSILTSITEVDLDLGDLSLAAGIAVPLAIAVVALVLASVRLRSMDIA